MLTREQLAIIALGLAAPKKLTPVQLQKTVFLFQKAIEEGNWNKMLASKYEFVPYDYGPFCKQVYRDVSAARVEGLADVDESSRYVQYAATSIGKQQAEQSLEDLPAPLANHMRDLAKWVRQQSFSGLVGSIYRKYPEMKANSVFRG